MSATPESKLQKKIQARLREEFPGIFIRKMHGGPHARAGVCDFIILYNGIMFGFEVKVPGNEPTKLQEKTLREIDDNGGVAAVINTPDQAYHIVRRALKKQKMGVTGR
jgi:hypothetical protein